MSLHPQPPSPLIPAETARVARAAFPKGNPYLTLRDDLGPVFADESTRNRGSAPGDWQGVGGESPR